MLTLLLNSIFQRPKLWFGGARFSNAIPFKKIEKVTFSSRTLSKTTFESLSTITSLRHVQLLNCTFLLSDLLLLESLPELLTLSLRGSRIEFGDMSPEQVAQRLQRFPDLASMILDSGVGSIQDWEDVVDLLKELKSNLVLILLDTPKGSQKMKECFDVAAKVLEKEYGSDFGSILKRQN